MLSASCSAASSCRRRCAGRSGRSCAARPVTQRSAKSFLTVTGSVGAMPVLLPAHHRPVGCREWVFPVRRSGRPRWLPDTVGWPTQNRPYAHLQQCARLAVLALRVGREHLRDRRDARRRCQPVSPRRDPARSACATANRSSKAAHGRARRPGLPPWRRQAGWRESKETGAKARLGRREPLSAITAECVPGGHAHPRPGDHLRFLDRLPGRLPSLLPGVRGPAGYRRAAAGIRVAAAPLAATRAPGHEPHDDEYGHRDQSDDDKRLERSHDPARSRDGKPYGEDRAEDCPDDPAHVPSMPPDLCRR